jgi:hypothetical protein
MLRAPISLTMTAAAWDSGESTKYKSAEEHWDQRRNPPQASIDKEQAGRDLPHLRPWSPRRMCSRRVVFPEPRKPERRVTGRRESTGEEEEADSVKAIVKSEKVNEWSEKGQQKGCCLRRLDGSQS